MSEAYEREQAESKQKASRGKLPPEVQAWMDDDRNAWYHEDEDLAAAFEGILAKQIKENQGKPIKEIMELADHPFFIGVQYHPELKSTVENPHPLFVKFVQASKWYADNKTGVAVQMENQVS